MLLLILLSFCGESPKKAKSEDVLTGYNIDSNKLINQILEDDSLKKIDTVNVIYKLGHENKYLNGRIFQRRHGKLKIDTIALWPKDSLYSIFVPNETLITLTFDDLTKVWLNAGTKFTFPSNIIKNRFIKLEGEGYFESNNNFKAITIQTGVYTYQYVNGKFNIKEFDSSRRDIVTLLPGRLKLNDKPGSLDFKGYECLIFANNPFHFYKNQCGCDPEECTSWTRGLFAPDFKFSCKPFYESLGRWYGVNFIYSNKVEYCHLEGHLPLQSSLKDLLKVLEFNNVIYKLSLTEGRDKLKIIILK